jgi:hypothetical protein
LSRPPGFVGKFDYEDEEDAGLNFLRFERAVKLLGFEHFCARDGRTPLILVYCVVCGSKIQLKSLDPKGVMNWYIKRIIAYVRFLMYFEVFERRNV